MCLLCYAVTPRPLGLTGVTARPSLYSLHVLCDVSACSVLAADPFLHSLVASHFAGLITQGMQASDAACIATG